MDLQLSVLLPLASLLFLRDAHCQDPCGWSIEGYKDCITVTLPPEYAYYDTCFAVFGYTLPNQAVLQNCQHCHTSFINWGEYPDNLKANLARQMTHHQEHRKGWAGCPNGANNNDHCIKIVNDSSNPLPWECATCNSSFEEEYICSWILPRPTPFKSIAITDQETGTTVSGVPSETTELESDSSESSSITPAAVGATLAVLLVLIVVAVILLVLRRRKRHAFQRSAGPGSFGNNTYGSGAAVKFKCKDPSVPEEQTDASTPEYAQIRKEKPWAGGSTGRHTDNEHHFVNNELYAGTGESQSPPGSLAATSTRDQDDVAEEDDKVLTLADNDLYG